MPTTLQTRSLAAAALVAVASIVSALLSAQTAPSNRWDAWIGCWQPAGPSLSAQPTVCVVPAGANAVAITTINGDTIVSHDTVVADGTRWDVRKGGCEGWQQAAWSDDGRRVYLHSSTTCDKTMARTTDGLLAFSPTGEWLDVQRLDASGAGGVRVVHYREVTSPGGLPADVAAAIEARKLAIATERTALGGPVTTADVIDVSHHVDSTVAAAWLTERGQAFSVDGKQLVMLANAGVPGIVTDVIVALSYPKELAVARGVPGEGTMVESATDSARIANAYFSNRYDRYMPYGWGPSALGYAYGYGYGCSPFDYGLSAYSPYDYSPYGYGGCGSRYGFGYSGFGGYGPYGYGGYGYGGPVIYTPVVVIPGAVAVPHGQAVKGHGYTKGGGTATPSGSTTGGTATPRTTSSPAPASTPARTAVPRGSGKPEESGSTASHAPWSGSGSPGVTTSGYSAGPGGGSHAAVASAPAQQSTGATAKAKP